MLIKKTADNHFFLEIQRVSRAMYFYFFYEIRNSKNSFRFFFLFHVSFIDCFSAVFSYGLSLEFFGFDG